jgi:cytochrome c oxidase subunit 2
LLLALAAISLLALLLSGCDTDTPQNTFDTKGEVAEKQAENFYWAMWPALVIMILVLGGLVVIALRWRERSPDQPPPKQIHGNTRLEIAWTIAPAILLLIIGVPMVAMIGDIGRAPASDAYVIDVIGQRYSWLFQYPEEVDGEGNPIQSINEAHIPADREVAFQLRSIDVIHSFWIPKLGGKKDVFPCNFVEPEEGAPPTPKGEPPNCDGGKLNVLWLRADEPGTFSGQCAEYCGLEHALMTMTIHADSEDDFRAWVREELVGGSGGGN